MHASRLVLAGRLGTPVYVVLAAFAGETVRAVTGVVLHVVVARSTVLTGIAIALVYPVLAVGTCVAWATDARVVVDAVDAGAAVHTRGFGTVLVVGLTVDAREPELTLTCVRVDVFLADCTVLAGIRQTLIDIDLAVLATEAVDAEAGVVADTVETRTTVLAGI